MEQPIVNEIINRDKEHLVAFVDLLGFEAISQSLTGDKYSEVLALLKSFSAMKTKKAQFRRIGSYSQLRAAISVFSDNVVISYPLDVMDLVDPIETLLLILGEDLASFAEQALRQGFLIRGGIAKGKLFHEDGVVFGEGLIKAYKLETTVAVYPRVILSSEISSTFQNDLTGVGFAKDEDGLFSLDYLKILRLKYDQYAKVDGPEAFKSFYKLLDQLAKQTIVNFLNKNKEKELAKWQWFASYLERSWGKYK